MRIYGTIPPGMRPTPRCGLCGAAKFSRTYRNANDQAVTVDLCHVCDVPVEQRPDGA